VTAGPRLVALPGTLLDRRSLLGVLGDRPHALNVLGESPTLAAEIDRLVELHAADRPCIWLGHSLGAIVALHLARRHPEAVVALVLLGASGVDGAAGHARRGAQWRTAQRLGLRALATSKLGPGYGLQPGDLLLAGLADQAEAVGMRRFEHQLTYANTRPSLVCPLQRFEVPMLLLSGGADELCPPARSDELLAVSPRARHFSLAGAGHLFPMQDAGWVRHHLHQFLHEEAFA